MNQETNKNDWQSKLTSQETPMDVQRFWDQLEPKLPPQKKQRKGAWWFWPTLAVVGLGIAVVFVLLPKQQEIVAASIASNPVQQNVDGRSDSQINSDVNHSSAQELSKQPNNQADRETTQKEQLNNSEKDRVRTRKSLDHPSGQTITSDGINTPSNPRKIGAQSTLRQSERLVQTIPLNQQPENQNQGIEIGRNELSLPLNEQQQTELNTLPSKDILMLEYNPGSWSPEEIILKKQTIKPGWHWALTVSGGPGMGFRKLSATDSTFATWIDRRRQQETVLESWQVRGMVEAVSPGGFVIETGLQWTRQNERLDWSRDSSVWQWGHAEGFLVDQNGGATPWSDTAWQSYTLTRTVRHYNQISTLDIPIGLGYQLSKSGWSVRATGGVLINLNQRASGTSIHPEGWPVQWQSTSDVKLATQLGLGYYAHLRFAYDLLDKVTVFIQPTYSSYPGNRQEGSAYSLKYGQANVQIGLHWKLNR